MDDNAVSGFRGIAMVIWKQRADLETLNGWSQRTLMRALDKEPGNRQQSAGAFAAELFAAT